MDLDDLAGINTFPGAWLFKDLKSLKLTSHVLLGKCVISILPVSSTLSNAIED